MNDSKMEPSVPFSVGLVDIHLLRQQKLLQALEMAALAHNVDHSLFLVVHFVDAHDFGRILELQILNNAKLVVFACQMDQLVAFAVFALDFFLVQAVVLELLEDLGKFFHVPFAAVALKQAAFLVD